MYLLKHATGAPTNSIIEFTFHYVSIKTKFNDINIIVAFVFTFHYVSIKTTDRDTQKYIYVIYIPLCIY